MGKINSVTLTRKETLTLNPQSVESENTNIEANPKGKMGKGRPTSPLCSATASSAREEKEAEPGALLAGLWPKGRCSQAARRWRAHPLGSALAGEGAGDGTESSARSRSLSLGLCTIEREKGRSRMGVRVSADAAGRAFFIRARRSGDHRMQSDNSD